MHSDPYDILNVNKGENLEYYTKQYRSLIKEHHPDLGGSKEEFIKIQNAYEEIQDDLQTDKSSEDIISQVTTNSDSSKNSQSKYVYPSHVRCINYTVLTKKNTKAEVVFENWDDYSYPTMTEFTVTQGLSILEAAEYNDNTWPFSCRGGACSNCAIKLINGDVETSSFHILSQDLLNKGYRLSCIGKPLSRDIDLIYNINEHPNIQDYLLPDRSE